MPSEFKKIVVAEMDRRLEGVDQCLLIDYQGLNSEMTVDLRATLRKSGLRLNVVHNRLVRRVFAGRAGMPPAFGSLFSGPTALLYGAKGTRDASLVAAKVIAAWRKKNKDLAAVKGGVLQGRVLTATEVVALAKIPEPAVLRAGLAGTMLSLAPCLAVAAQGLLGHFAGCVKARVEAMEKGA